LWEREGESQASECCRYLKKKHKWKKKEIYQISIPEIKIIIEENILLSWMP
jgi:hypothetical protein